jgi:hypothetical protein
LALRCTISLPAADSSKDTSSSTWTALGALKQLEIGDRTVFTSKTLRAFNPRRGDAVAFVALPGEGTNIASAGW